MKQEPLFDLYLVASCSLWLGLAWLGADLLAALEQRSIDPRPMLGLAVVLGFLPVLANRPRLDYADVGRCWLYVLLFSIVATAWPAACLALGWRPASKLYPYPTRELLWAWVYAGVCVAGLAGVRALWIARRLAA